MVFGEIVVNGMFMFKWDFFYVNLGMVVVVELEDFVFFWQYGIFVGLVFQ